MCCRVRLLQVEVPTRTDLTLLEQEWYLLQATLAPVEHAQRLHWAVALCWRRFVSGRIAACYSSMSAEHKADLQQSGLTGAYDSARRYRLDGCWSACVMIGVRNALTVEVRRARTGCWIGRPSRQRLVQIRHLRRDNPDWTLDQIAAYLQVPASSVRLLVCAARQPMRLQGLGECTDRGWDDLLTDNSPSEDDLAELLEDKRRLFRLRAAVGGLPEPARSLLVDYWGLNDVAPVKNIRSLARRYRIDESEVEGYLDNLYIHLRDVVCNQPATVSSEPLTEHTVQRLAYEGYANSYLTWREVVNDLELDCVREAKLAARLHALRSQLPLLTDDDRQRLNIHTLVRNEDCYQLAAQGHTWAEVAVLAGVACELTASRHARTFAHRSRSGSHP